MLNATRRTHCGNESEKGRTGVTTLAQSGSDTDATTKSIRTNSIAPYTVGLFTSLITGGSTTCQDFRKAGNIIMLLCLACGSKKRRCSICGTNAITDSSNQKENKSARSGIECAQDGETEKNKKPHQTTKRRKRNAQKGNSAGHRDTDRDTHTHIPIGRCKPIQI